MRICQHHLFYNAMKLEINRFKSNPALILPGVPEHNYVIPKSGELSRRNNCRITKFFVKGGKKVPACFNVRTSYQRNHYRITRVSVFLFSARRSNMCAEFFNSLSCVPAMRGCIAGGVELKDRSVRVLALRSLLNTALTPLARTTLDYLMDHFAR